MCRLKVVLFATGRGANAATYRPNRDESQWWNRRDALVRCVAAFLFGPEHESRELVILYDEDMSRMHMTYRKPKESAPEACLVPTEQAIVSLWKRAASQESGEQVEINGLTCRLVVSQTIKAQVCGMDSKRSVLEYLQRECSLEFLREHKLNSSSAVLLRKTNKKALMDVWSAWKQQQAKDESSGEGSAEALESILEELLRPESPQVKQVVAGILHESSEGELPCWNIEPSLLPSMQVCLFLGAVRDMTVPENRCLEDLCRRLGVPHVKIRLGPVPEFTSKILTVTAMHHAQGIMGPAISALLVNAVNRKRPRVEEVSSNNTSAGVPALHFVCMVPIASSQFSSELADRNRVLWCVVRCTVASLWRSRLVGTGKGGNSPLINRLTLVFEDGRVLTMEQDQLVTSLAEQHQAAPSEFQILKALQAKVEALAPAGSMDLKSKAVAILSELVNDSSTKPQCVLSMKGGGTGIGIGRAFYDFDQVIDTERDSSAFVLLQIGPRSHGKLKLQKYLLRACRKLNLPVVDRPVLDSSCQDGEAAAITMLQHYCYQGRLFGMLKDSLSTKES